MKGFHASDLWGLAGIMLFLVFVYLVLHNWMASNTILGTTFNGAGGLFKTLQGRG